MERQITCALDHLNIGETQSLLSEQMVFDLERKTARRIKKQTMKKAGFGKRPGLFVQRLVPGLAALIIILVSLWGLGPSNVAATVKRLFSLIPGYGIIENNTGFKYILASPVQAENETAVLILKNAVATEKSVEVLFQLSRKEYLGGDTLPLKIDPESFVRPRFKLRIGENTYDSYSGSTGSNGITDISQLSFRIKPQDLDKDVGLNLEAADHGLSLNFSLKDYETFASPEEIGPTDYHNDISLTAVPTFSEDSVTVDLYAINKSGYTIKSYGKPYKHDDFADDLRLETNERSIPYDPPGSYFGTNSQFTFSLTERDRDLTLKIPYIVVKSDEQRTVTLPVPIDNEKLTVNKRVEFADTTLIILSIQKNEPTEGPTRGESGLTLEVRHENRDPNMIILHPDYTVLGRAAKGGSSLTLEYTEGGHTAHITPGSEPRGKIKLLIGNPQYCLISEYTLDLGR